MIHRAFLFQLYPTPDQEKRLLEYAGGARFIYNLALEQRRDWWRQFQATQGRHISWASQSLEVTQLRREIAWLADIPRDLLEQALRDLDSAFKHFFAGAGFPSFRTKERNASFRFQGRNVQTKKLNAKWATVRIPGCGAIKYRQTRAIPGVLRNIAVSCRQGRWFVACSTEQEAGTIRPASGAIGIDRGVANTLTLSNGEMRSVPDSVAASIDARKRAQRVLARRKLGSSRRNRQRARVAVLHARTAAARQHWLHEQTTDIARRYGTVALEKLGTARMTKSGVGKRGLNRAILEQGWSRFATLLEYKLAERGGVLHYVNPAYTSQTCASCGSVDARSRKSQAVFDCVDCGHLAHADVNAALNILRRSPACVEVAGYSAVEARPGEMLSHLENLAA